MADTVPLISISTEDGGPVHEAEADIDEHTDCENVSMSEGENDAEAEEEARAKEVIASRIRRKHKRKPKTNTNTIFVDEGDEGGVTDVETVECDQDDDVPASPVIQPSVEDFNNMFDAFKPQIVQIVDDHEGKVHIKTIIKGVVAQDISDLSEISDDEDATTAKFQTHREVATDVESLDGSDDELSDCKSDSGEIHRVIQQTELGGSTQAAESLEERAGGSGGPPSPAPTAALLCPSRAYLRKKTRKSASRKQAAAVAAAAARQASNLLVASGSDNDPLTDVETIDNVRSESSFRQNLSVGAPVEEDGATDIEDFRLSDDELNAPGIVVTGEVSGDESNDDFHSGRSSRLELTDVEMDGSEAGVVPTVSIGLALPTAADDPLTDVEDIDGVEVREQPPQVRPPNGPALHSAQQQVIVIQEDENGVETVVSRKTGAEAAALLRVEPPEESALTDIEEMGVSGDEDELHIRSSASPAPPEQEAEGSSIQVTDMESAPEEASSGLLVPCQPGGGVSDTEDMELSDVENLAEAEAEQSADMQQQESSNADVDGSKPSLPSQPAGTDSA